MSVRRFPHPAWLSLACMLLASAPLPAYAQPGCTDPQASNFNAAATQNDGSCLYPLTVHAPTLQATLPPELMEISGLTRAGGHWWAHADSGGKPEFFRLNPQTGQVLQKIMLQNAQNRDWEEVWADSTALFFGDFGNNANSRSDLGIYRVPMDKIGPASTVVLPSGDWQFVPFA
ncbi:MAG TPA: hypothetical protein PK971_16930, partial [Saprospiraceae bacterium]|nr:hypothetical protein [Saprospiraceae bacterium]